MTGRPSGLTYADAGVDIDAGAALVEAIKPLAQATRRPGADAALGGFGALFDLKAAGYADPLIVATTDGVGTKLKVAIETGLHEGVGVDLVAMCVNDLLAQGAEPLLFLDYYAVGKLDVEAGAKVVAGIAEGCRLAGAALVGGETAEMPGMYAPGDYDLAGFSIGAVERGRVLPRLDQQAAGDVLIGLASSGPHSNGYSLIRRIVEASGLVWSAPAPFAPEQSLAQALMTPTRIYVRSVLPLIRGGLIEGAAHITGGGLIENPPRAIADGLEPRFDWGAWTAPPVFEWLQQAGGVDPHEMRRTFNCGLGFVLIVKPDKAEAVLASLADAGETAVVCGELVKAPHVNRTRVGILLSGRGSDAMALIEAARAADYPGEIALVVSNNPQAAGIDRAAAAGIATLVIDHRPFGKNREAHERAIDAALREAQVGFVALAGYMRVLTPYLVEAWRGRMINIHPSLLPAFPGLHTHQRALEAGVRLHGCTVHWVSDGVDEGRPIGQAAVPVLDGDDEESLAARVLAAEHRLYPACLAAAISGVAPAPGADAVLANPRLA